MKVICFGDSLTSCGGKAGSFTDILQDRFPSHTFLNRGVGGETFADGLLRFESDVLSQTPDIVLVEFGANDWWQDERPPAKWAEDLETIVGKVTQTGANVIILGVFGPYQDENGTFLEKTYGIDERAIEYRELEADIAKKYNCRYLPNIQKNIIDNRCCWRDKNHPNEYGNRFIADIIEPILEELLNTPALPIRKPVLKTLKDIWEEAIELGGNNFAVVYGDKRLNYREADKQVKKLAAGITVKTGTPHPKVAVFLPNCLEYYLIYWAVVRLGGIIVPLNTWLKTDSLTSILATVNPDMLILQNLRNSSLMESLQSFSPSVTASMTETAEGIISFSELFSESDLENHPSVSEDECTIIMHTSGTTSTPKGAMMRHSDLMFNIMTTINAHQFSADDIHLLVNPMFHCTALYSSLPTAAYQKTPVVITSTTSPDKLMQLVEEEKISTFLSTPVICQNIVNLPEIDKYNSSSLRIIAYAGSPMPVNTIHMLKQIFPEVDLHNFFGLTETISMTHVLTGEEADERPDSVGRLLPFVNAIIVDENNQEMPAGKEGELLFARDNVIPGYYNQPDKLTASIRTIGDKEWFDTGDLASIDEEGYFFIKGRKKDMIIVGGENVFSSEVEAVLGQHEHIREAAVKGITATGVRESLGEIVKAYVVTDNTELTERDIKRFCVDRLASYKVPVEIEFIEKLPRNPSGKVVKSELK